MKTISQLTQENGGKIYVTFKNESECKAFYNIAQNEGFTFGAQKPTQKHKTDIVAVNSDKTLCYVGIIGRIALGCQRNKAIDFSDIICC